MAIHLLDTHTAELIAAGEVVERPASVVKELCENAIDAGAKTITVEIERGGIALIRVVDDGSGIEAEDIPLAFLRHATSKVQTQEDLDAIRTLGFRGEALASIASVARVELLTKNDKDEYATLYRIEGGNELSVEEAAAPRGTSFSVHDLFYNTPARMKFLKKDATEAAYVTETVGRLALSHPKIAFRYARDGKKVFATPGSGELRAAAWEVLGGEFAKQLVEVESFDGPYWVKGLVTPPSAARASRSMQYFFVNKRNVKNLTMMAALEQAYRGMTMHGRYPGGILFMRLPPDMVDVNVHPAKTEVRFAREQEVFGAIYRAVKGALLSQTQLHPQNMVLHARQEEASPPEAPPAADAPPPAPPKEDTAAIAAQPPAQPVTASPGQVQAYNNMVRQTAALADALQSEEGVVPYQIAAPQPQSVEVEQIPFSPLEEMPPAPQVPPINADEAPMPVDDTPPEVQQQSFAPPRQEEELLLVGEVFKTYIVAQRGNTLCFIDKHAAHERILYEKIAAQRGAVDIQRMLSPQNVNLSAAEKSALLQNGEALAAAGLEVEDFGGNSVLVRGVPADVHTDDVENLIVEVAARLAVNAEDSMNEKTEWVMHSVACRAAVKAGDHSRPQELLHLARQIINGEVPPFCPHGRPVVLQIEKTELEKQFGRLG